MSDIKFAYEPRKQFRAFHERNQRWSALVCHRRAGKTVACINDIITRATYTRKRAARYGYVAPFFRQAKDVAWEYLKYYASPLIVGKPKESVLRVELFNGAWITLYGADNPDAFRGMYFDGLIIDEFGDMRPKLWSENLLPTLADRRGWAVFIGTPKGPNHFKDRWDTAITDPTWFTLMLKASESGILPAEELAMMRSQMTEDEYEQEFECSFEAAVTGTYFASILNKMMGQVNIEVPHDVEQEVEVAMDLGRKDSTAMWFWQDKPDGVAMIDYEEFSGHHIDFYIDLLNSKKYKYKKIWVPHDAKVKTLATKRSTIEQMLDAGFPMDLVPKLEKQQGIDAARLMLPIVHFDKKCYDGVQALRAYHRQFDDIKKVHKEKPDHDWSSDAADAFRYFALVARKGHNIAPGGRTVVDYKRKPEHLVAEPYTLDELWAEREEFMDQRDILRID